MALCAILSACSAGGTAPRSGGGAAAAGSLSCAGYPKPAGITVNGATYTQVCLIIKKSAPVTPTVSVLTVVGNLIGHGSDTTLSAFPVNVRVIAQAKDQASATTLAQSVVISTANGTVSASPAQVAYPQQLEIDFEIFTAPTTNLTLTDSVGDQAVDNYNATLKLTAQKGDFSLDTVQGQATVRTNVGDIAATLAGSAWIGAGMTATTQVGDIAISHPASYQAAFTGTTNVGQVSIDGQQATGTRSTPPATVSAGSGAPITLQSDVGDIAVTATQ